MTPTDDRESPAGPVLLEDSAIRRVFLIRHADASDGDRDRNRGRSLTEIGKRQAEALASRAAGWQLDAIFCSDKHRAYETACALRKHHPGIAWIVDPMFRELNARSLEGGPDEALKARLEAVWQTVLDTPHATTAIVTHSGLIKYLIGRAIQYEGRLKPRFPSAYTGVTALAVKPDGKAYLKFFNDTSHLTPDLAVGPKRPWIEDPATRRWLF